MLHVNQSAAIAFESALPAAPNLSNVVSLRSPGASFLPEWKRRPARYRPFANFAEALSAYEAARRRCREACRARMALSAPFIASGPSAATIALSFSRTIDEALAKCSDLPADLVAAMREEEQASADYETARLRLTQTPAFGADITKKLEIITRQFDDVLGTEDPQDVRMAYRRPDDFPGTVEFYALHDDILRAVTGGADPVLRRPWDEAHQRYCDAEIASRAPDLSEEQWEEASDRAAELEGELHRTPAPDIAAVAEKVRLTLRPQVEDYRDDSVDDPRTIATALADDDCTVREQVLAYQDLLRLSGLRPEIASVTAFDTAPFIEAAQAAGVTLTVVDDEAGDLRVGSVPDHLRETFAGLRQAELRVLKRALNQRERLH